MRVDVQITIVMLLLIIAGGLIALLRRPQRMIAIDTTPLKELMASFKHHVAVEAVLTLVTEIESRPELRVNLAQHSQQVVDAALAHQVNALAACLQKIQAELVRQRGYLASTNASTAPCAHGDYSGNVKALEAQQAEVQSQLDTLNSIIQERVAVS